MVDGPHPKSFSEHFRIQGSSFVWEFAYLTAAVLSVHACFVSYMSLFQLMLHLRFSLIFILCLLCLFTFVFVFLVILVVISISSSLALKQRSLIIN